MQYFHSLAMSDDRWKAENDEITACIIPTTKLNNSYNIFYDRFLPFLEKLGIIYPYRQPLSLVRLAYKQSLKPDILNFFKISTNNTDGNMYLFVIHAWLLHRRLVELDQERLNLLYWEKVWDVYRRFLLSHQILDTMFSTYLQEMQQLAIDFCLKLDYTFETDSKYWTGILRYILWKHLYESYGDSIHDAHIGELVVYILKMFHFLRHLPTEAFCSGGFVWPDWVPI